MVVAGRKLTAEASPRIAWGMCSTMCCGVSQGSSMNWRITLARTTVVGTTIRAVRSVGSATEQNMAIAAIRTKKDARANHVTRRFGSERSFTAKRNMR